jgi:hypothetical protein
VYFQKSITRANTTLARTQLTNYSIGMKVSKEYRQEVYEYVEMLLGRHLTFEEHDDLRDIMLSYVLDASNMKTTMRRFFCLHDWKIDKKIEAGEKIRMFVKCAKCDKRTKKKMPTRSMRVS